MEFTGALAELTPLERSEYLLQKLILGKKKGQPPYTCRLMPAAAHEMDSYPLASEHRWECAHDYAIMAGSLIDFYLDTCVSALRENQENPERQGKLMVC